MNRPESAGRLLKILGAGFGLAVIVGNTIGAGILRTPGEAAGQLPHLWAFVAVWIAGGLYALLGAAQIAELGTLLPLSGGQYVFVRRAIGDYAGFVVGWSDWLSTCGTSAAVSIVIAELAGDLLPALDARTGFVAAAIVVFFAVLQWRGVRWGSRAQELTSLLKGLAFLVLVVACFALPGGATAPSPAAAAAAPVWYVGLIVAMQAVIYTYDGWTGVIYFSEEIREPARDIPRSLYGGLFAVILTYLFVNAALLHVIPLAAMAGDKMVAGTAARLVFGAQGDATLRLLMIVSMLSSINAYQLMASRVLFAMSRDGLFFRLASAVNRGGTPTTALLTGTAVAVLFILSGTFEKVIALLAFFFVANYSLSFLSLFILRRQLPEAPRPVRAWGYPWSTAAALAGSVAFLVGAVFGDTRNAVEALILLAASYPVFRLARFLTHRVMPSGS